MLVKLKMSSYKKEVIKRWKDTNAYKEYEEKTTGYTDDKFGLLKERMQEIFSKFSFNLKTEIPSSDPKTQTLVSELQTFITDNFYTCTKEILSGLATMYVCDDRFKEFIDKGSVDTSEYVLDAVKYYCK